jgi:uncharacterized OB-fold protein
VRPIRDEATDAYWEAASAGRLFVQRCPTTGALQWYPRAHCLADWSAAPEWVEASGRGTVFSFAIVRRAPAAGLTTPYVLALVELEEGVLVTANLVGVEPDAVCIGLPVRVVPERVDGWSEALPQFAPVA